MKIFDGLEETHRLNLYVSESCCHQNSHCFSGAVSSLLRDSSVLQAQIHNMKDFILFQNAGGVWNRIFLGATNKRPKIKKILKDLGHQYVYR